MIVNIDFTSLESAVLQLQEALELYESDLALSHPRLQRQLRSAVIQAFEFTYELSFKMIKRYLEMVSANPAEFDSMTFAQIVREAFRRGLIESELSVWRKYRQNRSITSHTYNENKAQMVFEGAPKFLVEARFLLDQLQTRSASLDSTS